MTRADMTFLMEKAAGLWLIVIGLGWVPELMDRIVEGEPTSAGHSVRYLFLETIVPMAAGAFLLMRRTPRSAAPVPGTATSSPQGPLWRTDWLWVGCKLLGAYALLNGTTSLVTTLAWFSDARAGGIILFGGVIGSFIWLAAGSMLFFGDRLWRLACRQVPAPARPAG